MVLLNGLITNDKFCIIRVSQQKLRYLRRPPAFTCQTTNACAYLRDEPQHRGGAHEATVASPSSVSVDLGCGTAVGSGLPTSPGMDPSEPVSARLPPFPSLARAEVRYEDGDLYASVDEPSDPGSNHWAAAGAVAETPGVARGAAAD